MLDRDVRQALKDVLSAKYVRSSTLLREELGLCLGEARVDIAVINGSVVGYEIKSARDRLDRLPAQVAVYTKVLDSAILVSAGRHLDKARTLLPPWWGIWHAEDRGHGMAFEEVRESALNVDTDPLAVAQLLWRDEALALLEERSLARGLRSATRWRLWHALVEGLEPSELAREVRQRLRARRDWPGG